MQILANLPQVVAATNQGWQEYLRTAIRSPLALLEAVGIRPSPEFEFSPDFPTFAPLPFVSRMERGNWYDPLLRQVLPLRSELNSIAGFDVDPLREIEHERASGLLQKYAGRVLLIASGVCAVNCRYCFRRNYPYGAAPKSLAAWEPSLADIGADHSLREVILSGGDPLMLVDDTLRAMVAHIHHFAHIQRLRIHTRLPVVIPQRVTANLLETIADYRRPVTIVLHCNHARELDHEVQHACQRIREVPNVTLLNQSVLLAGVNDSSQALISLSERLYECGVLPYYLHQLDRVAGSHHFEVPLARGRELVAEMRLALPGYLVPRYVQENPGELSKTLL